MSGDEITFGEFQMLLANAAYRPTVSKLLARWFEYEVAADPTVVHTPDGEAVNLLELHREIQADPIKRAELYQAAMTLWR